MKKKILLFISLLLIMTNVKALSFNVELTNIEDKTNNTSVGTITNIDVDNKELDVLFQNEGEQVSFEVTVSNTGNKAGTLKKIDVTSTSQKIDYTNNLPEGGLAINGNDTNKVLITATVKAGATKGKSSSEIKLTYDYEEGTCPEGETLSEDETECLCPTGYERNEAGKCVKPESEVINCEKDEIYNETKKICEKKVTPIPEDTPKTGDNILLILLLFILAGLALYVFLFKKFKSVKTRRTFGIVTAVTTLCVSVLVLITIFGVDGLLGAIINPITKSKEIVIKVNEDIDLIEVWDGNCDLDVADLTPSNIFDGGTGTESDPYKIKTAEQLSCFAKSINNGTTYAGQYVKQTKNIKLNDSLNEQATAGDLSNANLWIAAGGKEAGTHFDGTYDGDNHIISGLYITTESSPNEYFRGMFGYTINATFKNMTLSDIYVYSQNNVASLIGFGLENLVLDNVKTYGNLTGVGDSAGIVSNFNGNNNGSYGKLVITNTTNYVNVTGTYAVSGIVHRIEGLMDNTEYNLIVRNSGNAGNLTITSRGAGGAGLIGYSYNTNGNTLVENSYNIGNLYSTGDRPSLNVNGGLIGSITGILTMKDSYNAGDFVNMTRMVECGGLIGSMTGKETYIDNCFNSGDITFVGVEDLLDGMTYSVYDSFDSQSVGGIAGNISKKLVITNSYNTGNLSGPVSYMAGLVGVSSPYNNESYMENCYNTGDIDGKDNVGGLVGTGPKINKSYNTGKVTIFGSIRGGGLVGYESGTITNSYNSGDIYLTGRLGDSGQVGGVCAYGNSIKNSYNRGQIYAKYNASFIGGLVGQSVPVTNSYNSGNITFDDADSSNRNSIIIGGTNAQGSATNTYNTGNITVKINKKKGSSGSQTIAGINAQGGSTDSVNTGNITVTFGDESYIWSTDVYGICYDNANGNFQAGTISFGDYQLVTDASKYLYIGEINGNIYNSTGNKFKNPNGVALACIGRWNECNLEASQNVGVYTTEDAPDIMSVINGDDAFEILEGETLPTLKVFNN